MGYNYEPINPTLAVACRVKSHVREYDVTELLRILKDFPTFFPEHKDKRLYSLLVGVQFDDSIQRLAAKKGLLVAQVADGNFKLLTTDSFQPKNFQVGM